MTILDAMHDPHLFRPWFVDRASWRAWEAFFAALFGLPMDPDALAIYQRGTGRSRPPMVNGGYKVRETCEVL